MKHPFSHFRHFEQPQTEEISSQISRRAGALTRNDGFSLVELSIVLVILGLLTGGILTGQSLIRAAELRSVTTEFNQYKTAAYTFRDKYFAFPGDMRNATDFWGNAATCPGNNASPSTDTTTCNGNGDGVIDRNTPTSNEVFRAWQHLANAGLVEGTYTGVAGSATATSPASIIGVNVPRSKIGNAGWSFYGYDSRAFGVSDTSFFEGRYGAPLFFFGSTAGGTAATVQAILTAEEAWNIDTKMDDGRPATGTVVSREEDGGGASDDCTDLAPSNSASLAASQYMLTNSGEVCSLVFKAGR